MQKIGQQLRYSLSLSIANCEKQNFVGDNICDKCFFGVNINVVSSAYSDMYIG